MSATISIRCNSSDQKKKLKELISYGFDSIVEDLTEAEEEEYREIIEIVEKEV